MSTLFDRIVLRSDLRIPYCDQLYAQVKARILAGKLQPGEALPSERDLIATLQIARTTLRRAFGRLETEGFVQRRRGVGSFVADSKHWLKKSESLRLGIVVWDTTLTKRHKEMFGHLCSEAATHGLQVQTLHGENATTGRKIEELAAEARIDGLILMPSGTRPRTEQLTDLAYPVVVMETHLAQPGVDHVLIDSFQGVYNGVQELIRLGHRQIGYVGGLLSAFSPKPGASLPHFRLAQDSYERCLAYRSALDDADIAFRQNLCFELPYALDQTEEWVRQIRKSHATMTAVVAFSDSLAVNILHACRANGLRVPEDLSVIGFGNSAPEAKSGELATCAFDPARMARLGVQRILERIRHGGLGGVSIAVPSTFKPGASIGPPHHRIPAKQQIPRNKPTHR